MEQGEIEQKIIVQCRKERRPLPDRIKNAPELMLGLELYFGAFFDLSSSRSGLGDGPISFMSVREYAQIYEFSEEQTEDLHYFILEMDKVFLDWKKKKNGG